MKSEEWNHFLIYAFGIDLLPDKYWIKNCSKMFCTFFDFLGPKNPKKNSELGGNKNSIFE